MSDVSYLSKRRAASAPAAPAGRRAHPGLIVSILGLAILAYATLPALLGPALPAIAQDLHRSVGNLGWILIAYLLSAAVLTPIIGRLGDMAGKRRALLAVLVLLALGTLAAALARNLPELIAARAVQGAAGAIVPLAIGIIRDQLPRERVSVTVGVLAATFGIGAGVGFVAAGPILDHLSWHWLFWLPLILVTVALIGVAVGVPESSVRTPGRLDLLGAAILSAALVSLLLAISKGSEWGWTHVWTVGLIVLGAAALLGFVLIELRVHEPLIDVRLLARREIWTINSVSLTLGFGLFGSFLLIPTLLELPTNIGYGFGKPVSEAALFLLPTTAGILIFGPLSGLLARRYGARLPMVLGAAAATAALALPALRHDAAWQLLASGALSGAGFGLASAAMSNALVERVPAGQTGQATSINAIVQTIGGSIGSAVVAAVMTSHATLEGPPTDDAFTLGFWCCAGAAFLALVAALAVPRRSDGARRLRDGTVALSVGKVEADLSGEVFDPA